MIASVSSAARRALRVAILDYEPLALTEGAVKVAVHRLRARYRELLREEIAQTVTTQAEVDEEIRHLFQVFSN